MIGQVLHRKAGPTPHLALRRIALVLLLALCLHQVGMGAFARTHGAGGTGNDVAVVEGHHNDCLGHPVPSRICRVTEPFVQRLSLALVFFALLAAFTIPPSHQSVATGAADWQWPPNRRRALLQVFLR